MSYGSFHYIAIFQVILFVFSSVHTFTSKDAIWQPGVIIQPEINLSILYKFYYTFYNLVHYYCKGRACMGLVTRTTGSFTDYCVIVVT